MEMQRRLRWRGRRRWWGRGRMRWWKRRGLKDGWIAMNVDHWYDRRRGDEAAPPAGVVVFRKGGVLRNQFLFETTETGTEASFGDIRDKTFLSRLFLFYTETESFGVWIEPNKQKSYQTSVIESIFWCFFQKIQGCFGVLVCFVCFASISMSVLVVSIQVRNTEINRNNPKFSVKQIETVCLVCFASISMSVSVVSIQVRNTEINRNNPKFSVKQILFRFVSVQTNNIFCLFRGNPYA